MGETTEYPSGAGENAVTNEMVAVVGIGVCAASLRSLAKLFSAIDQIPPSAYLIAVLQQDGVEIGAVLDVLTQQSGLPVAIATDGERVRANHIYVGGPDDMVTLQSDHLHVRTATEPVGHRGTVDSLLISIAEHAHERTVAVLLGGLGTDGTAGVTATKKFGGLSIGEEMPDSDATGLQGVAGPFGVLDVHLPADQIAPQIALYLNDLVNAEKEAGQEGGPEASEVQISQITTVLRGVTGHDFHSYKKGTFLRRVHRRLQVLQIDSVDDYIERLRGDRGEVQDLFQDLLIGVTQFFRDPQEFEILEREIPKLFQGKFPDEAFRVWVLGCATGEEAYSLAILLREYTSTLARPPLVQIFATDLDARALGLARAGRYAASIAGHVRPDRLERWFVREGDTYCVSKELREMCIFSPHNVTKDAPFSRIDILSCRNLLIYLNGDLQNRVIPIFHFSLRPGGVLFLGSSENVTRHQRLFAPVDRRSRVFRRLETATRIPPDFPLSSRASVPRTFPFRDAGLPVPSRLPGATGRQAEVIAERYAPAYVVVDRQYDVLHFSGRTGWFLEPMAGVATLNLINLIHRDLRIDVRGALHRAQAEGARVELSRLMLHQEGQSISLNLIVEPIGSGGHGDVDMFVVLFQDIGQAPASAVDGARLENDEHVQRLESELRLTRDRLQATIEELESTNEELKSSNEEYQSINEELQSANEEMETSKEELQSVNEELQTVNGELGHRVVELGQANSDLNNLLEATQIATVFLDNELRIRSFTPSMTEIFHLLESDVGRPLGHVVSRVAYAGLQEDVRRVLKTLVPVNRTVIDPATQRHFAARVLPYRSTDNYINGAVVTFTDLTAVHEAEIALRRSEQRLQALLSASSEVVYRMNVDWTEMLEIRGGFLPEMQDGRQWLSRFIPPEDQALVTTAFAEAIREKRAFELEHRVQLARGGVGWTVSRAVPIMGPDDTIVEWFGAASDVTAQHEAEDAMRESEQRLHSLVQGLPLLVWRAVGAGNWSWASRQWTDFTGQDEPDSHGWGWLDPVHPDDHDTARAAWTRAIEQGVYQAEFRIRHASDGLYRWFQTRALPVRNEDGTILEWIGTCTDVDDTRNLQERQAVLVAELQHRTRNLLSVVRQMAQKTARASNGLADFWSRYRDRLDALARVQSLLSRLNEHDRVTFDELVQTELAAHGADPDADPRVVLEGPTGIRLRSTTVQTLALALHELATNAVKYGALSQPGAKLAIRWSIMAEGQPAGQPWLHVDWRETGVKMPPANGRPQGGGQGRELIERALPYQLDARTTYDFKDDGVHCTISMPVSATNVTG